MARNGSGTYSLPAGNPVVTGTTISSTWANTTFSDIGTALTGSVAADGQTPITANLPMNGFKFTGLGAGGVAGDSVRYEQFASPPAIGNTAPNTGAFTTIGGTTITASTQFSGPGTGLSGTAASLSIGGTAASASALASTAGEKLPQISVTQAGGALTIAGIAKYLDFRSATLTSGTPSTVNADPADLVIPSGATLGSVTTVSARIVVAEMNNAGTSEYAVANISGGLQMDETNLISTTAIDTASDSATVWYSTTARSSLAYRVVAMFDAVNTAGAWGSPTLVQPAGGMAMPGVLRSANLGNYATTSGTSVDCTTIPSWAEEVIISIVGMSTNGTSLLLLQIGDNGGIETSGYISTADSDLTTSRSTAGFSIQTNLANATYTQHGMMVLTRHKASTNTWVLNGSLAFGETDGLSNFAGSKSLTGILDRIRFTTAGGVDTFDAGSFSVIVRGAV